MNFLELLMCEEDDAGIMVMPDINQFHDDAIYITDFSKSLNLYQPDDCTIES